MPNVASFYSTFGIKDTLSEDLTRIRGTAERMMQSLEKTMATPFTEADRAASLLERHVEKLASKTLTGLVSIKTIQDLENANTLVESLFNRLSKLSSATLTSPGASNTFQRLAALQQTIGTAQQVAVPSPDAYIRQQAAIAASIRPATMSMLAPQRPNYYLPTGFEPLRLMPEGPETPHPLRGNIRYEQPDTDLDSMMKRRSVIGRNADIIINRHLKERDEQERTEGINTLRNRTADERNRNPYGPYQGLQQMDVRQDTTRLFREQRGEVLHLADAYSKLSAAERNEIRVTSEGLRARGQRGYSLALNALDEVDAQRRGGFGTGAGGHAFRYASQNAAFALEDYLISSQYGGPKAGFRAITNNLTAIAAAATGSFHPLVGAGIIGATAVAGASAPLVYDYFTSTNDAQMKREDMQFADRSAMSNSNISRSIGINNLGQNYQGLRSAANQTANDIAAFQARQANRMSRSIGLNEIVAGKQSYGGHNWYNLYDWNSNMMETLGASVGSLFGNSWSRRQLNRWEQEGYATRQLDRLKEEEGKDWSPDRAASEAKSLIKQRRAAEEARGTYMASRESDLKFGQEEVGFGIRGLSGEMVDPQERFQSRLANIDQQRAIQKRAEKNPSLLTSQLEAFDVEEEGLRTRLPLEQAQHLKAVRERGFDVRQQLNSMNPNTDARTRSELDLFKQRMMEDKSIGVGQRGELFKAADAQADRRIQENQWSDRSRFASMEVDDRKRLLEQMKIGAEQIEQNPNFDLGEKQSFLRRFLKAGARDLANTDRMPSLGSVIEEGTGADVGLRQSFFGPRMKTEEQDSQVFQDIKQLLERIDASIKANKPVAAGVR